MQAAVQTIAAAKNGSLYAKGVVFRVLFLFCESAPYSAPELLLYVVAVLCAIQVLFKGIECEPVNFRDSFIPFSGIEPAYKTSRSTLFLPCVRVLVLISREASIVNL